MYAERVYKFSENPNGAKSLTRSKPRVGSPETRETLPIGSLGNNDGNILHSQGMVSQRIDSMADYKRKSPLPAGKPFTKRLKGNNFAPSPLRTTGLVNDQQDDRVIYTNRSLGIDEILPPMVGHTRILSNSEMKPLGQFCQRKHPRHEPPIRDNLSSWIDLPCYRWTSQAFEKLPSEDLDFLLNQKGVHLFPPLPCLKAFIRCFFRLVDPSLPVLDRATFQNDLVSQTLSPFLLHAVLFSASFHVDDGAIKDAGFADRESARTYFFQRAKVLYSLDLERRQIPILQGLILLSLWRDSHDEEKQSRYWLNTAMTLATQMGMHRSLRETSVLSESEKRLWRRIWWSLYCRERHTGPATGCPISLSADDVDVEDLTEEDFIPTECQNRMGADTGNSATPWKDADIVLEPLSQVAICHMVQWVKLAKICEWHSSGSVHTKPQDDKIIRQQYCASSSKVRDVPAKVSDIGSELKQWRNEVPGNLRLDNSCNEGWTIDTYYPLLLHLAYERAITLHYRPLSLQNIATEVCSASQARTVMFNSAIEILRIVELLLQNDLLLYCPPYTYFALSVCFSSNAVRMTAIFTAMATLTEEVRQTRRDSTRNLLAKAKVGLGIVAFKELLKVQMAGSYWAYNLFQEIVDRDFLLDEEDRPTLQKLQAPTTTLFNPADLNWPITGPSTYFNEAAGNSLDDGDGAHYEQAPSDTILQGFDLINNDVLNFLSMVQCRQIG